MKPYPSLFRALLLASFIAGFSATPVAAQESAAGPKLVGTYPLPGELFTDRIVFYFDAPLAPVEAADTLIIVDPPLQGEWSQGTHHVALAVQADQNRKPGRYRAVFLPALRGTDGAPAVQPAAPVQFTDFALALEDVAYGPITPQTATIQLRFSAPVAWEQVQDHLTVTDVNGANVDFTSPRRATSSAHLVSVPALETAPYTVSLSPGLTDHTGRFQTRAALEATLPALGNFALRDITWEHVDQETDRIALKVSYPVDATRFLDHFRVVPEGETNPLPLTQASSDEKDELVYRFPRTAPAYKALRYTYTPGLTLVPPLYPQTDITGTIALKREALRIEYHNWESRGVEPPRLTLYFNAQVDPDDMKGHVTVTPAVNGLEIRPGTYGGVDLVAEWVEKQDYRITIAAGLVDREDRLGVAQPIHWNAGRAPERSGIGFTHEGFYYFPRRQAGPLTIQARNVKKAKVTLYQLFPSNLPRALEDFQEGKAPESFGYNFGRKVDELEVQFPEAPGTTVETPLPVADFMPEGLKGIFGLSLSPGYDYYNTKIVVWTDIGVLAHWQDGQFLVYAHNLWDLAPLAGAKVTLYSAKHQPLGETQTGEDGVARIDGLDPELGRPRAVIVETDDDYTFLALNERGEDTVGFDYAMPEYTGDGYDAFLYADRNLYRPGEPMHVRWLVRQADGSMLAGAPLKLRVVDPKEKVREFTHTLSAWGSGTAEVETARDWLTGAYRLELWVPGADTALTTQTVNVEDFVPNRISVAVRPASPFWLPGDQHAVTVTGTQLSGGPARERKASAAAILAKAPWKPEGWTEYTFTNDAPYNGDVRELGEAQTDGLGNATFSFTWQPAKDMSFPVEATLRGEVFEAGGRSVASRTKAFAFPAPESLGLAVASGASPNTVDVAVAAVRPDGTPSDAGAATVTLEKKQWSYYLRRYADRNEPNWSDNFAALQTETVSLRDGKGSVTLKIPDGYGTYRVKVTREGSPQYATQSFWAYRGQAYLSDASRPSLITLTADATAYNIGDTATVRVDSPFDGVAIVVVQGAAIEKAITVPISGGAGRFELPLEAGYHPNVWVEATVIHPVEPGAPLTHPYSSFAMLNLPVRDPSKTLQVSFPGLPGEIRPLTQLDVAVNVAGPDGAPLASEITLALVDEGIHQILQYQNPDPAAWFQRDRRPEYRRAHYYDQVAYDFTGAKIGGGELLKKRLGEDDATVDDNWIKPLALWSGAVETDASGNATIAMTIPEFAGKVRLVAVATTGTKAGSQAANVTIRRPVILQATLPRFAGPGDTFEATVLVQNKRDFPVVAALEATATAPLAMEPFSQRWELPANGEALARIPMRAEDMTGSGTVQWRMVSTGPDGATLDEYAEDMPLKIQAPTIYQVRSEMVILESGEQRVFQNSEFREDALLTSRITATPNPLVRVRKALDYVVGYPYGCAEQTVSRCMPLFLLGQAAARTGDGWEATYFQQFLQAGIDRLLAMQTGNGGIGYWPGARESYTYGSIYAAHFLTLAKQDPALSVPDDAYEKLMRFLRERIPLDPAAGSGALYNYSYACYVRALAKDTSVMEDIGSLDTIPTPTAARQWLALAMLAISGAEDQAQQYLLRCPSAPHDAREQGGSLNSAIRNDAITLMTQIALGVDQSLVHPQAEKLLRYLEQRPWSTHEASFLITALAEYLKKYPGDVTQARATIAAPDGTTEQSGDFQYNSKHSGPGGVYTVTNSGPAPIYIHFATEGILQNPDVPAASNGIALARGFTGKSGAVAPDALKHGENYLVTVKITCDEDFENVVLADLLPGGLEIENPRLDGTAMAAWKLSGGVIPSFLEMRDDRLIAAFDRLARGTHEFHYAVRAVTAGAFRHPGANAECMYDVKFNGRTAGSSVTIAPPD